MHPQEGGDRHSHYATPHNDEKRYRRASVTVQSGVQNRLSKVDRGVRDLQLSLTRYERHHPNNRVASRSQIDENIRTTNRTVALINNSIIKASPNAQIHPMQTRHGSYPASFSTPRKLVDFLYIPAETLNEIIRAYDILVPAQQIYRGQKRVAWADEQSVGNSTLWRAYRLFHLFQFLGAYRVAEDIREVVRDGMGGDRLVYVRRVTY